MDKTQKENTCQFLKNSIKTIELQISLMKKSQANPKLIQIEKDCFKNKIKLFEKLKC